MNFIWDNIFRKTQDADLRAVLKDNILFRDLSSRELTFLEKVVHVRTFHPGEIVFRQGEVGVGMYVVMKGRVEIFVSDPLAASEDYKEIFITHLGVGDFFGELSLVEEKGRRTASAVAREESILIGFFKPDLMEILSRSPHTGVKIMFRLAEVLGRRLKETTDKVSELRSALKELRAPPPLEDNNGKASGHSAP